MRLEKSSWLQCQHPSLLTNLLLLHASPRTFLHSSVPRLELGVLQEVTQDTQQIQCSLWPIILLTVSSLGQVATTELESTIGRSSCGILDEASAGLVLVLGMGTYDRWSWVSLGRAFTKRANTFSFEEKSSKLCWFPSRPSLDVLPVFRTVQYVPFLVLSLCRFLSSFFPFDGGLSLSPFSDDSQCLGLCRSLLVFACNPASWKSHQNFVALLAEVRVQITGAMLLYLLFSCSRSLLISTYHWRHEANLFLCFAAEFVHCVAIFQISSALTLLVKHQMLPHGMWRNLVEVNVFHDVSFGSVFVCLCPPLSKTDSQIT